MGRSAWFVAVLLLGCAPLEEGEGTQGDSATDSTTGTSTATTPTASSASATMSASGSASASGTTTDASTGILETDSTTDPLTATDTDPPGTSSTTVADGTTTSTGTDASSSGSGSGSGSSGSTGNPTGSTTAGSSSSSTGGCGFLDSEDNDDQDNATDLDEAACDDGAETFDASLEPGDPDWFNFQSPWDCGMGSDPVVEVSIDIDASVCVYADCTAGGKNPMVNCADGVADTAPNGEPGCCGDGTVELGVNCTGGPDESLDLWVEVDDGPDVCTDYTLTYEVTAV